MVIGQSNWNLIFLVSFSFLFFGETLTSNDISHGVTSGLLFQPSNQRWAYNIFRHQCGEHAKSCCLVGQCVTLNSVRHEIVSTLTIVSYDKVQWRSRAERWLRSVCVRFFITNITQPDTILQDTIMSYKYTWILNCLSYDWTVNDEWKGTWNDPPNVMLLDGSASPALRH